MQRIEVLTQDILNEYVLLLAEREDLVCQLAARARCDLSPPLSEREQPGTTKKLDVFVEDVDAVEALDTCGALPSEDAMNKVSTLTPYCTSSFDGVLPGQLEGNHPIESPTSAIITKRLDPKLSAKDGQGGATKSTTVRWQPVEDATNVELLENVSAATSGKKTKSKFATPLYKDTGMCQAIVRNPAYEIYMVCVVMLNVIWVGIDADHNDRALLINAHWVFQVMEHLFCFLFTTDLLLRFMALRSIRHGARNLTFVFDLFLVTLMIFEVWLISLLALALGWDREDKMPQIWVLRIVRLLRITKSSRVVILAQYFPELRCLVKAMFAAMRSVLGISLLLMIAVYIFAIVLRQLADGLEIGRLYFSTVSESMLTLLLYGALLDEISTLYLDVVREDAKCAIALGIFIAIAALTLMNMLVGVMCQVMAVVSSLEQEAMSFQFLKRELMAAVELYDDDENGEISRKEFRLMMSDARALRALARAGVDTEAVIEFSDTYFQSDEHGRSHEKTFTVDEFISLLLKFQGSKAASIRDMIELKHVFQNQISRQNLQASRLEERVKLMTSNQVIPSKSAPASLLPALRPGSSPVL